MRRIVLLTLLALFAQNVAAQHRGAAGHGFAHGGFASSGHGFAPRTGRAYASHYGYAGLLYGQESDGGYVSSPYTPQLVSLSPPPVVVEPPPLPVHPVVISYDWSAHPAPVADAESDLPSFAIVLRDGSVRSAVTVAAVAGGLDAVDLDERHLRIPMSQVDRDATLRLNRQRNLNLHLPAQP